MTDDKRLFVLAILVLLTACGTPYTALPTYTPYPTCTPIVVTATPEPVSFIVTFESLMQAIGAIGGIRKMVPAEMPYGVWEVTGENCMVAIFGTKQVGDFGADTYRQSTFTMTGYEGAVEILLFDRSVTYPHTCTFTFLGVYQEK